MTRSQVAWRVSRDAGCKIADCLGPKISARDAMLAALAAQVSESNPTLFNLHAVWLTGKWKVSEQEPKTYNSVIRLPEDGQVIFLKQGELCENSGECVPFGLETHRLADERAKSDWPMKLHLTPDAPMYIAILLGKGEYELVPMPNGTLLLLATGCPAVKGACEDIKQVWRPLTPDSRLHEADLAEKSFQK